MKSKLILASNVFVLAESLSGHRWKQDVCNHVTAAGRDIVRDILANRGQPPRYVALGSGTTAATDTDTALETEGYRQTISNVIVSASKVSYVLYIANADATDMVTGTDGPVTELGLFSTGAYTSSAGGILFAKSLITAVEKTDDVTLTIVWEINVSSV